MGSTLTKPFNKNKNAFMTQMLENAHNEKPIFRYILNKEEMVNLVGKTAGFTKKNLEKLDKLLYGDNYDELLV